MVALLKEGMMQTILDLKDSWLLLGILLATPVYFIGGYLRFWKIKVNNEGYSSGYSFTVQPDGSVNTLPYGVFGVGSKSVSNH